MQAPVDYPIDDPARDAHFTEDELTYAAFLDRAQSVEPIAADELPQAAQAANTTARFFSIDTTPSEPERPMATSTAVPKPLAAIAQSLLAGELASQRVNASAVFSRWSRAIR